MQLTGLSQALRQSSAYSDVLARLRQQDTDLSLNVIRAARPFVVGALAQDWPAPVVVLTGRIKRAYNVTEQLPVWFPEGHILRYSEPTPQFYERVPWGEDVIRNRLETLEALAAEPDEVTQRTVIVSSARALMQRTIPFNQFRRKSMTLETGQRWRIDQLLSAWVALGYEAAPVVVEPGTFSRRGGVIDVYPIAAAQPIRIDFFDDEIDTLRTFDPATQRSETSLKRIIISPAREALPENAPQVAKHLEAWFGTLPPEEDDMTTSITDAEKLAHGVAFPYLEHYLPFMYPNPVNLLDYAPADALIVVEDWEELRDVVQEIEEQAARARDEQMNIRSLSPDHPQPFIDWDSLVATLHERRVLHLSRSPVEEDDDTALAESFAGLFHPGGRFGGQLRPMLSELRDLRRKGDSVVVVTEQAGRLTQLWYEQDASEFLPTVNDLPAAPQSQTVTFVTGTLQEGWTFSHGGKGTHLLTDAEIFGWSRPEPRRRKATHRTKSPESDFADWRDGDFVVHVDYGIGQFAGMRHRTVEGNDREYLVVQYGGGDMLFVPIHQADRLTKYVGADDTPPAVHRLGQPDWARVKSRAQKAVEEEARELIAIYAARARATGHAYGPDTHWQHELEASFPYVETEDQLRAVREVKADMEAAYPMDRLICGDVGFGKTEVALRAAFKAVMEGKQVAVLVPTTVLAQQHYETFSNRLVNFPVNVEMLSRFRTKEEQNRLMPKIASGEIDILIGTHRILSSDVTFKNLSMIIVDEEQRFGVKHKEHFKKLRAHIDVLTLTATPIPRTLYMSMSGIRDISMIQTPPEDRLPVITHVGKFDPHLIRQAVLREIERGGQIFVVHNRVRTIDAMRDQLQEIVPEARIIIGHGQMNERQLETVMTRFGQGEYDILLSTTIIESGIDIPNANTLIVDRADMFGMAQLYQIRGRVGRSAQQGYAYFFHSKKINDEARTRLETLAENTSLGTGYQIAIRDLELRGAGDILSTRQTGHLASVGLHLYTQLLSDAIHKLKGDKPDQTDHKPVSSPGIVIDLPLPAYVPNDWIEEMALRLQIYRRIAGLTALPDVEAMRNELRDRFGQLPNAVDGLLYQIEVKLLAQQANATHVMARDGTMQIKLPYLGEINRAALEQHLGDDVQVSRVAITFPMTDETWQLRLLDILRELSAGVQTPTTELGM
ncbi:MAG: transcription-repair coupling factor [Anaerolineae bacterium]